MVATRETDNAIMKFYRELGYTDYKTRQEPKTDLDGMVLEWYSQGWNAKYPFWDVQPYCPVFKESERKLIQSHLNNGCGVGIIMGL